MSAPTRADHARSMARYLLHHRHQPHACGIVFASFKGGQSPLRHQAALASCHFGGHETWWTVQADSEADAAGRLPFCVEQRTTITRVREAQIP